jgi:hypothetical protein
MSLINAATIPAGFVLRIVWSTLVNASKALAPRSFREQCETLRAMTAGRRSRSARLLVGSTPSSVRNDRTRARSCCAPIPSSSLDCLHR